ncbi:flavin monoamine oxidase family protein [Leptospira santarosai]|uniref:flavin monoamine oxidase family protein n=2 Tax=Leptospira santarosai TaxID=28183 RepID=UPI0024AEABAC|nr:NAD(P)/FAD-dependent oxidoreductase [Leptospira santarosai]MDI7173024.1 FAD-dependent oxidoreductase [Leptospira santarosai]MDI7192502.1 FAD-dependent oxidoreductase [Leptospira santarosai]MDO6392574.1 FAD-dependent oxidoreductase [Leptospira santarosai]MDO6397075.1 FAD-dependent oxidoreductase [Leptospira santarosai]MDO6402340.1 FAD-dependent oxidoreductase [Leptospira santarosai]
MKLSRSEFIKLGILTAAGVSSLPGIKLRAQETLPRKTVIVLGGGIAGLYASYLLGKTGIKVQLIEATDRLGGRIRTIADVSGNFLDLGAEWIQAEHKTAKSLIRELGLKTTDFEVQSDLFFGSYRKFGTWDISPKSQEILNKLVQMNSKINSSQQQELDRISFYNFLIYQGVTPEDLNLLNFKYSLYYGDSLRSLSAQKVLSDLVNFPKYNTRVEGGMEALTKALVSSLENTETIFTDPVVSVFQGEGKVTVTTASGKQTEGKACICTLPANQLTSIQWEPGLDKEKKLSALRIRYSRIYKTFLMLREAPWTKKNFSAYSDSAAGFIYDAGTKANSEDKILGMISTGDRYDVLASSTDAMKVEYIRLALECLGQNRDLQVLRIQSSETSQSKYVPTGIATFPPGSYGSVISLLKPMDRIFFAGEHTAELNGTVEGALSSAIRAVNQI